MRPCKSGALLFWLLCLAACFRASGPINTDKERNKMLRGTRREQVQERLNEIMSAGRISRSQMMEVLAQFDEFQRRRVEIEGLYLGRAVGVANGNLFTGNNLDEVMQKARSQFQSALMYAEEPVSIQSLLQQEIRH